MKKTEDKISVKEFTDFIRAVSSEIEQAQVKVISAANVQMLQHYWKIGHFILFAQKKMGWGGKVIDKISKAIRKEYPKKKGYSPRNLMYMCQFAKLYSLDILKQMLIADEELHAISAEKVLSVSKMLNEFEIGQEVPAQLQIANLPVDTFAQEPLAQIELIFTNSPIAKINWASHVILMDSKLPLGKRYWYMKEALEFGWSSNILAMQIETDLFKRQVMSRKVSNFTATIPQSHSDLANYLLKDPYIFDMVNAKENADERNIEEQLVSHVSQYLLEMGNGFAFVARQKHFQIGNKDFYADLILYNIKLRAYVVIELKATSFKPEHIGQLNFYVNVIDDKMRGEYDNKTIGLLLCKGKDEIVAKYALEGYNQALGVSDYQLSNAIPENLKSTLPSIEEVEQELTQLLEQRKMES